jgi:hypothetical protein
MTIVNVPYLKGSDTWIGIAIAVAIFVLLGGIKISQLRNAK